jgi:hypothetical protein
MPAPYDVVELAANLARVRVNDAILNGLAGNVLTDTQAFTLPIVNISWRRMQDALVTQGAGRFQGEAVVSGISAVSAGTDPSTQIALSWTSTPALPSDFIYPIWVRERATSVGGTFYGMDNARKGLPAVPKTNRNIFWQWREDAIYIPGATVAVDLQIRYAAFLPDFALSGGSFSSVVLPVMRCIDAFAWFMAYEVAVARKGAEAAAGFLKNAVAACAVLVDHEPDTPRPMEGSRNPNVADVLTSNGGAQ